MAHGSAVQEVGGWRGVWVSLSGDGEDHEWRGKSLAPSPSMRSTFGDCHLAVLLHVSSFRRLVFGRLAVGPESQEELIYVAEVGRPVFAPPAAGSPGGSADRWCGPGGVTIARGVRAEDG